MTSTCMPFCSANWKVLLPVWRGLTGAGWDSLARSGAAVAAARPAISERTQTAANLEPVKPAAALFFLGSRRLLAALGDFGIGIDRLAIVGRDGGAQDAVGEAAIGILDRGALVGIQAGADAGVGPLRLGIGQQQLLARRVIAPHAVGH